MPHKLIFSRNTDIDKIAFLNWRTSKYDDIQNLHVLAEGFMESAITLANDCVEDNQSHRADMLIFPILFNANHGIELYLKSILWTLNKILKNGKKLEGGHNLKQLYATVKSRIKEYPGQVTLSEFNKSTKGLKLYLDELFDKVNAKPKNDKMDFTRYPIDKNYESHFYVDSLRNVEIDLENFVSRFSAIHESLQNLAEFLYFQELKNEW